MRGVGAVLLLTIGIGLLLAGGALSMLAGHRDGAGAFGGSLERLETAGHAVVVPDLDALLRRDAPFAVAGDRTRLRITARSGDEPAFLGLGPMPETVGYLAAVPHATVDQVGIGRGPLPVRLTTVTPPAPGASPAPPGASPAPHAGTPASPGAGPAPPGVQTFWRLSGDGFLDLDPGRLGGPPLSLVVMRPDGAAGVDVQVRAEVRMGWLDPTRWGLLAGGILLVIGAAIVLVRPVRPREVVFVVEPAQVPVLAARLGVATLDPGADRGRSCSGENDPAESGPAESGPGKDGPGKGGSADRPETLAELTGLARRPAPAWPAPPPDWPAPPPD